MNVPVLGLPLRLCRGFRRTPLNRLIPVVFVPLPLTILLLKENRAISGKLLGLFGNGVGVHFVVFVRNRSVNIPIRIHNVIFRPSHFPPNQSRFRRCDGRAGFPQRYGKSPKNLHRLPLVSDPKARYPYKFGRPPGEELNRRNGYT